MTTKDEIIRMAKEAAQQDGTNPPEKSVTLYAAKSSRFLEKFAALVAAAEREECAKVCADLLRQRDALLAAATQTIEENLHLADGDVCTLIHLKRGIEAMQKRIKEAK